MNRRTFLSTTLSTTLLATLATRQADARKPKLRVGVTDWNLKMTGKLEAIGLAKSLDFDGVQVSLGRKAADGKLPMDDLELIGRFKAESAARMIPIDGTCLDVLHVNYLKNDKLGEKWVSDGIRLTRGLGTKVMLLPFFGKGALQTPAEMDYVGDALRNLGPEAEKAGVILGLEDTISAPDNLRIVERSRSKAVQVYYDIGNSTLAGFEPAPEIRQLGSKQICQFHLKDNPNYLGEGKIDMSGVMRAIASIEYQGYANLETDSPSKSVEADMRRNLTYVRRVMQENGV